MDGTAQVDLRLPRCVHIRISCGFQYGPLRYLVDSLAWIRIIIGSTE